MVVYRKILTVFSVIFFVIGLALLLFPTVSTLLGYIVTDNIINNFDKQVENKIYNETFKEALENEEVDSNAYPIDKNGNRTSNTPLIFKEDLDRLYKDSISYNEDLKVNQRSLLIDEYSYTKQSFNLSTYGIFDGIYGYVSAPSINMKLPIYLGANETNMTYGAAHLTYTSLPIGGKSTNCVLAGHTGYIGRKFFDNLKNLNIGDTVKLTNYWDTLTYKVTRVGIYEPDESKEIFIKQGIDCLTMLTCINGGKERYYVICERL